MVSLETVLLGPYNGHIYIRNHSSQECTRGRYDDVYMGKRAEMSRTLDGKNNEGTRDTTEECQNSQPAVYRRPRPLVKGLLALASYWCVH